MSIANITKPKIVLKNGKPSEVILRWSDFQEILEKLEDAYDLGEIKRIMKSKPKFKGLDAFLK